jgi:hypothetical protein
MRCHVWKALPVLLALACGGCAEQVTGRVVDSSGRAVAHAAVEIHTGYGAMMRGEGARSDQTVADAEGSFKFSVPQHKGLITAKSDDGKQGKATVPAQGETVVVVR